MTPIILASASQTRLDMLRNAGLDVTADPARVDEVALREALTTEGAAPRDVADALAEAKARKRSQRHSAAMVLGCDQILELEGAILGKCTTRDSMRAHLALMRGKSHRLYSAAVVYLDGRPIWRHVGVAQMAMRPVSDQYLETYLDRNWPAVGASVGGYFIEGEGVRLFYRIEGDHFTILGLPLLPLLDFLIQRKDVPS